MDNFSHSISEKIADFNGQSIRVINLKIILMSSRFPVKAAPLRITVADGVTTAESWTHQYSGNLKELDAWFTTDAFRHMADIVTITMDVNFEVFGEITEVDISNFINLPPNTDPNVIDADNAWLQNILDNQAP